MKKRHPQAQQEDQQNNICLDSEEEKKKRKKQWKMVDWTLPNTQETQRKEKESIHCHTPGHYKSRCPMICGFLYKKLGHIKTFVEKEKIA